MPKPRKPKFSTLINKYYADLDDLAKQNVMFEMGLRPAFHATPRRSRPWVVWREHPPRMHFS